MRNSTGYWGINLVASVTLRELLEAACGAGYQVFGVSSHAPPIDDRFVYDDELAVELAKQRGVPFCFGDDSHSVDMVGSGIIEARDYLLGQGVEEITVLEPASKGTGRRQISLA